MDRKSLPPARTSRPGREDRESPDLGKARDGVRIMEGRVAASSFEAHREERCSVLGQRLDVLREPDGDVDPPISLEPRDLSNERQEEP